MFTGFPAETLQFFLDIRFHNSVSYYNENKERYLTDVQAPFYAFIADMTPIMQQIDPQMEIRPYKCLSRLRRDTRFTRDKSPYRDHLWISFHRAAEPRDGSINYWFELGPQGTGWGLGFWGENRPVMDRFRREIVSDPARISGIISSCNLGSRHLVPAGSVHKRMAVPENVPPHLVPWYTAKELYIPQVRPEMGWTSSREIFARVADDFLALAPIYRMLRGIQDDLNDEQADQSAASPAAKARPADEW